LALRRVGKAVAGKVVEKRKSGHPLFVHEAIIKRKSGHPLFVHEAIIMGVHFPLLVHEPLIVGVHSLRPFSPEK